MPTSRLTYVLFLCAGYGLAAAIACSSLVWPMGRDQGVFAWVGDTILSGGAPYRDAWEVKGPATYWVYAAAQALFGRNFWSLRLLDLLLTTSTLAALWWMLRSIRPRAVAHCGLLLAALIYYDFYYWNTAQPDDWAAMCLVWATAMLVGGQGRHIGFKRRLVAGGFIGLAASFKWINVVHCAPLLLLDQVLYDGAFRQRVERGLVVLSGLAACGVAVTASLAWQGALDEFVAIQFRFNPAVHATAHDWSVNQAVQNVWTFLRRNAGISWVLLLLVPPRVEKRAFALWCACWPYAGLAAALAILQNKSYRYHWFATQWMITILVVLGLVRLLHLISARDAASRDAGSPTEGHGDIDKTACRREWLLNCGAAGGVVLLQLLWLVQGYRFSIGPASDLLSGRVSTKQYYDSGPFGIYGYGDFSLAADVQVADYLRQHTGEGQTVLVWGFEPLVNYLAGRLPPTRFGFNYPLVTSKGTPFFQQYTRELMADVQRTPPAYVVIVDGDRNNLSQLTSRQALEMFPEFSDWIKQHYQLEKQIEDFALWRRR